MSERYSPKNLKTMAMLVLALGLAGLNNGCNQTTSTDSLADTTSSLLDTASNKTNNIFKNASNEDKNSASDFKNVSSLTPGQSAQKAADKAARNAALDAADRAHGALLREGHGGIITDQAVAEKTTQPRVKTGFRHPLFRRQ